MGTVLERLAREGLSEGMAFGQKWIVRESQPYENLRGKKKQNHETEETASAKALRQELAYMMEEQQEGRCGWRAVREEEC